MTSKMHWLYQGLAGLLHLLNLFGGIIPAKDQPFVAFGLAIIQAGIGLYGHYFTPDGVRIAALLLLALLLPGLAAAQTAPPAQHFSLSGSVVSFMGPSGAAPASVADGYFNLTQNLSAGYQQVTIPTLATAKLGMLAYSKPLSAWMGKKLTAKMVFDPSKISLTILAGAGKLNQSAMNVDRVAETAGICISYPVGANVSLRLACGQWLHGGIVNGFLATGVPGTPSSSTAAVSSGVTVHF